MRSLASGAVKQRAGFFRISLGWAAVFEVEEMRQFDNCFFFGLRLTAAR